MSMISRMRARNHRSKAVMALTEIASITEVDFSQFDLDEPLPEDLTTNGERGTLEAFMQRGSGKTLRELIGLGLVDTIELIGTPELLARGKRYEG